MVTVIAQNAKALQIGRSTTLVVIASSRVMPWMQLRPISSREILTPIPKALINLSPGVFC
jgi:hypothetical protein